MAETHIFSADDIREQWGTNDWRKSQEYEYVKGLDSASVRWEFLRRLCAYREAWNDLGSTAGAFGLGQLLDPRINAQNLGSTPKFLDSLLSGGALGNALPTPGVAVLLETRLGGGRDALAMHYGRQVMRLIENGYVLFSAHPQLSAHLQADRIRDQLSAFQSEERLSEEASSHRKNSGKVVGSERLLRVLDAYEQEGVCTGNAKRGIKSEIGRVVFGSVKNAAETQWNKEADAAYQRAQSAAMKISFC